VKVFPPGAPEEVRKTSAAVTPPSRAFHSTPLSTMTASTKRSARGSCVTMTTVFSNARLSSLSQESIYRPRLRVDVCPVGSSATIRSGSVTIASRSRPAAAPPPDSCCCRWCRGGVSPTAAERDLARRAVLSRGRSVASERQARRSRFALSTGTGCRTGRRDATWRARPGRERVLVEPRALPRATQTSAPVGLSRPPRGSGIVDLPEPRGP